MLGDNFIKCILKHTNYTSKNQPQNIKDTLRKLLIPYFLLIIFILTTNLMLIYGFYKTSRPFTITTKLFIYLSMVDIAMILLRAFYTFQSILNFEMPCLVVQVLIMSMEFSYIYGLTIFATISFLRYWSIKNPLQSISVSHIVFALIVQAIFCGVLTEIIIMMPDLKLEPRDRAKLFYFLPLLQFLAVGFVMYVNIMSYKILKSMKRKSGFSENIENTQRQKILSEANTCLLYITVFYILCPLPMLIWTFVSIFKIDILNIELHSRKINLFVLSQICFMSNSGINSLIVILRTKNLREHYKLNCCCSNNS